MNQVKPPKVYTYDGREKAPFQRRDAVVIDLDGTLANNKHRQHLMVGENKNWKEFFKLMGGDMVVDEVLFLQKLIFTHTDLAVIIATGRPSQYSAMTLAWLAFVGAPFTILMMRAEGDGTSDAECKHNMLTQLREMGYNIKFAIDDRPEVVNMWRVNGVPVLQPDATDWYKQKAVESPLLESLDMIRDCASRLPDSDEATHIRNHVISISAHIEALTHALREQRDVIERMKA